MSELSYGWINVCKSVYTHAYIGMNLAYHSFFAGIYITPLQEALPTPAPTNNVILSCWRNLRGQHISCIESLWWFRVVQCFSPGKNLVSKPSSEGASREGWIAVWRRWRRRRFPLLDVCFRGQGQVLLRWRHTQVISARHQDIVTSGQLHQRHSQPTRRHAGQGRRKRLPGPGCQRRTIRTAPLLHIHPHQRCLACVVGRHLWEPHDVIFDGVLADFRSGTAHARGSCRYFLSIIVVCYESSNIVGVRTNRLPQINRRYEFNKTAKRVSQLITLFMSRVYIGCARMRRISKASLLFV